MWGRPGGHLHLQVRVWEHVPMHQSPHMNRHLNTSSRSSTDGCGYLLPGFSPHGGPTLGQTGQPMVWQRTLRAAGGSCSLPGTRTHLKEREVDLCCPLPPLICWVPSGPPSSRLPLRGHRLKVQEASCLESSTAQGAPFATTSN